VVAALTRRFGDLDIAEEAAEAFATAVERWHTDGVPPNPGAWLTTTASRKAIDRIRGENKRDEKQREAHMLSVDNPPEPPGAIDDERLRLLFTCCHRTCVIDQILPHSPADYVRRPPVPAESPTLGLGHLQFEALITTARLSPNISDFALIAMLGLLGLRIFEACSATIENLGEEHGHRVLRTRRGRQDRSHPTTTGSSPSNRPSRRRL
jgi:integrase